MPNQGLETPEDPNLQGTEVPVSDPGAARREFDRLLDSTNIAEELDDELLEAIGAKVHEEYKLDLASKSQWDEMVDDWTKMAAQVKEPRSWPWQNAANVKFPLLSTASMQFAARAYPALIPADGKIVNMKVVGFDQQGQKADKADRLAKHMNYQLLQDMTDWEEEMDRLLLQLPIVGCLFKKTYFDEIQKKNVSCLLGPKDLVVNYWAPSLESAHRKTEVRLMTRNEIVALKNANIFLDVDLGDPKTGPEAPMVFDVHKGLMPWAIDPATPYVILEQHRFWDLDEDGYDEPYIVTIDEASQKVLRISARWDSDGIKTNDEGDLICIEPVEYYTK